MGIKVNDIADGEARGICRNPIYHQCNRRDAYTLAFAPRTAQKTKDHEWINEWKKGGSK